MKPLNPDCIYSVTPEHLIAYADGCLPESECQIIESFLVTNPAFREKIEALFFFSPSNSDSWQLLAPPDPSRSEWHRCKNQISSSIRLENDKIDSARSRSPVLLKSKAQLKSKAELKSRKWASAVFHYSIAVTVLLLILIIPALLWLSSPNKPDYHLALNSGKGSNNDLEHNISRNLLGNLSEKASGFLTTMNRPKEENDSPFDIVTNSDVEILSFTDNAWMGVVIGDHPFDIPINLASFDDVDVREIEPDNNGDFPELQLTAHGVDTPMILARLELPK